ncbi:unnamed protein product, partial [marine sediment metagenome]
LVWTGQDYPLAAWTVRMIAPVAFLSIMTGMGTAALRGKGRIGLELGYAVLGATILVVLYGPGYLLWGYKGMIGAEVVAGAISASWFLVAFARAESLRYMRHIRETLLRPLIIFGPVVALTVLLKPVFELQPSAANPRWSCLADVAMWGVLFGLAISVCGWFGLLSRSERALLGRFLPGGQHSAVKRALGYAGE